MELQENFNESDSSELHTKHSQISRPRPTSSGKNGKGAHRRTKPERPQEDRTIITRLEKEGLETQIRTKRREGHKYAASMLDGAIEHGIALALTVQCIHQNQDPTESTAPKHQKTRRSGCRIINRQPSRPTADSKRNTSVATSKRMHEQYC